MPDPHARRPARAGTWGACSASPGKLPFEQPNRFERVVNLRSAMALGLTAPQSVLPRADPLLE